MDNREKENRLMEEIKRHNQGLIEHVDHQIKTLAEQYGSLKGEISREVGSLRDSMNQRFDVLEMAVMENSHGIKELKADVKELKTNVKALQIGQERLEGRQQGLEEGQGRLEERQGKLEERQGRLEEGQGKLEERQGRLEEGQSGLSAQVERIERKLDAKLTDHEERIVRLEDKVYV